MRWPRRITTASENRIILERALSNVMAQRITIASESSTISESALSNVMAPTNHNCFRKLHYFGKRFDQRDGPDESQLLQKAPLVWKEL